MTTFESTTRIKKPVNEVYLFLADMNNHEKLMTGDISDWSSTTDEATFSIRNMLKLSLKVDERIEDEGVTIIPAEKPPFDIELKWALLADNDFTDVSYTISADLNMMMKMLAAGPLQKLADDEAANLYKLLNLKML